MSLKPKTLKQQFTLIADELPRDLGDGLVLRHVTGSDVEPLAQFNGWVHGVDHFDPLVAAWTRDFCSESHPSCGPSNVSIVQDKASGKIISTMCLIPQTWTYAGVSFSVGRVEAVGTASEYRRRGLVRTQMEYWHARSEAMGHLVQSITGIYWYYRQFGYEYALDLGGGRAVLLTSIPTLKEGDVEPYRLRPLAPDDLPLAKSLYARECARSLVACPRSDELWEHMLTGYSPESWEHRPFQIIETAGGRAVGYLAPSRELWRDAYVIHEFAVVEGRSIREIMPCALRQLRVLGETQAAAQNKTITQLFFSLGREHPMYDATPELFAKPRPPYGWYIRVSDVPSFLRHIAPALEARLQQSPVAGHTGELLINEYTGGFRLVFEKGKISTVEPWQAPESPDKWHCAFPPLVFLKLLFGYRTLEELRAAYADCWARDEAAVLLDALFPQQPSHVVPIG